MLKSTEENLINILRRFDVPGNAAKIYLFLLKNGPHSAYRVSKDSGVNSAVVYREIERLKSKNLVYQLGSKKKKYEAINGQGLLKHLKKKNKEDEIILENSLIELLENSSSLISMKLPEYSDLIDQILKNLNGAKKEILIRGWDEELDQFYQILKEKEKDGLILHILSFTPQNRRIGNSYSYNIDAGTIKENWKRGLGIAIDKNIVIVGNKIGRDPIQGLLTNDPLIVESIRDQILLDIALFKSKSS
jgi:sugar-specific transcriptional regulator TrmB